jgi:hypothetical protein
MKPIAHLMICKHAIHHDHVSWCNCDLQDDQPFSESCTTLDYMICPLKGRDDKDVRLGKRKE